jgi:hypothetical protein
MSLLCYNNAMKHVRITLEDAFHHAIYRGINGEEIVFGKRNKAHNFF